MEEFKSDQITVILEKKEDCIVNLNVKASSLLCKKAKQLALKEAKKEISISGFRKGKAPNEYILKQHPRQVENIWQKKIGDLAFMESEKLIKIYPASFSTKINYDLKDFKEEEANLTFSFETEPSPPDVDIEKFKSEPIKKREIKEKDVEETIRQAQFFFGKWTKVERPIKEGDYVILDLESLETKEKIFNDVRFEIKKGSIANWMKSLLIGAKKGDIIEGISKPDEDADPKEKEKFEQKKVKIIIKVVEEIALPEKNDEFAKKMGAENLETLYKKVKQNLEKKIEEESLFQKRTQVNKFLITNYSFDLPKSLLAEELNFRKNKILENKKSKELWDKASPEEKKQFEDGLLQDSKESIMIFYHSRKIAHDAKIIPTKEEINEEAKKIILSQTSFSKEPNLKNIPEKTKAFALSSLYMQKMQDYILNK